jgi:hypothetical protein
MAIPDHLNFPHDHTSIREAGQCEPCRNRNIELSQGAPDAFALWFHHLADGHEADVVTGECDCCHETMAHGSQPESVSLVRSWDPTGPIETSWACGCNAGTAVVTQVLSAAEAAALEDAGLPWFVLMYDPAPVMGTLALARPEPEDEDEPEGELAKVCVFCELREVLEHIAGKLLPTLPRATRRQAQPMVEALVRAVDRLERLIGDSSPRDN